MQSSNIDATSSAQGTAEPTKSPFRSEPNSPLAPKQQQDQERVTRARTTSSRAASGGPRTARSPDSYNYPRSRSEVASTSSSSSAMASSSRSREPSQPALSFMASSWKGGMPKNGSIGYGNHSLIQMIRAISLEAPEMDEDDISAEPTAGPSYSSGTRGDISDEEQSNRGYPPGGDYHRGLGSPSPHRSARSMSSTIDAIYSPMSRRKGKGRALPSLAEMTAEYEEVADPSHTLDLAAEPKDIPKSGEGNLLEYDPRAVKNLDVTNLPDTELDDCDNHDRQADQKAGTLSPRSTRKRTLAEKLQEVFEFEQVEDVLAEYPCWLFRSVLLQGFLYLTTGHLSFYAYLQRKEGQTIRSGSLSKKSSKSPRYSKFWFILRDDAFSWYNSAADPYFPVNQVDLQYVTGVETSRKNNQRFRVHTASRQFHFEAESEKSRQEWIKALKKAVVRAQNEGESVKIAIPLESITSLDVTEDLEFAKVTLRVAVQEVDALGETSMDEYYLSFGVDPQHVADEIHQAVVQVRLQLRTEPTSSTSRPPPRRVDTTERVRNLNKPSGAEGAQSKQPFTAVSAFALAQAQAKRLSSASFGLAAKLSPFGRDQTSRVEEQEPAAPATAVTRTSSSATITKLSPHQYPLEASQTMDPSQSLVVPGYQYPPGQDPAIYDPQSDSAWALPQWLRPAANLRGVAAARQLLPFTGRRVSETVSTGKRVTRQQVAKDESFEIVSAANLQDEYRVHFGTSEEVVFRHHGYLFRGLPIYGYLYLTTKHFAFRSTSLVAKSKMILPTSDIIAVQKARAYRFGYSGLVVVVRGHEEVFFELSTRERRTDILRQLEVQLEAARAEMAASRHQTKEQVQADMLKELESSNEPFSTSDDLEEASPIMFNSASSSFVTFRPPSSLHITCLTVGSRGDVQPYIALCLGLIKDGHRCKIASHPEYKDWIEGYGIEFSAVGGDPAELMRICVENGMFTVSFLREGVAKFRGWLDDLLETSWTACQETDLLIESPSTMAGAHIAEALQIPFFKAFTMPWTRTRAYPHAFAVPETKMGGSYNYMTYTIFDQVFWRAIAGQVNRWRQKKLKLQPTNQDKMESHKQPFLYNFSPSVVPAPLDWMEYIHVTGYWFLPNADATASNWQPPSSLLDFMAHARASGKKLVYIGFGSIVVSDPEALTRLIVEAVQQADVWTILSKGWSDRAVGPAETLEAQATKSVLGLEDQEALPRTIYNISSVPHDWLFPQVDAVCHHGGAGTTGASLRCGKPTIIRPFFGDQAFWAERVESLRVGRGLREMTVDTLAQALEYATTDETVRKRAEGLGEQIRKEDGVSSAIEAIYRDFEYAKSLIKRNTRLGDTTTTKGASKQDLVTGSPRMGGTASADSSDWDMLSERDEVGEMPDEREVESEVEEGGSEHESDQAGLAGSNEGRDTPPPFLTSQPKKL